MGRVLAKIDKCNGYVFMESFSSKNDVSNLFHCAVQSDNIKEQFEAISDIRERIASPESIRELRFRTSNDNNNDN